MALHRNSLVDLVEFTMTIPMGKTQFWNGTCTGGTTSTFVDSSRYEEDDYFQNLTPQAKVRIVSTTDGAAPLGQERYITDWVQSTGTGSPHSNFTAAPGAGDTYVILSEYEWAEIKLAINSAIDRAAEPRLQLLVPWVDETITLQASTYEYAIPDGFTTIHKISMEDSNGDYPDIILPSQYTIVHAEVPKIHLYRMHTEDQPRGHYWHGYFADDNSITASRHLRIEGFARQEKLDGENDQCYLNPNYVGYQAAAILHASRLSGYDSEDHKSKMEFCQGIADRYAAESKVNFPIGTKRIY